MNEVIIELLKAINKTRGIELPLDVDVYKTHSEEELADIILHEPTPHAVWVVDNVLYELRLNMDSLAEQKLYLTVGEDEPILVTQSTWAVDDYNPKETERLVGCYKPAIMFMQDYTHRHKLLKASVSMSEELENNSIEDFVNKTK